MNLSIFEFLDTALKQIKQKDFFIDFVANKTLIAFNSILKDNEHLLNITSRIKNEESIKEKMLRQNYFIRCKKPEDVITEFPDLVGIRIECRFNEDEKKIFREIRKKFHIRDEKTKLFRCEENDHVFLNLNEEQPQLQKNGFQIYKIDGVYIDSNGEYLRFELQIKSMVNLFWGEIDHRILYKNFTYMITEDFIRDIMYSIKSNLYTVDKQLSTVYKSLRDMETYSWESTKLQLKRIVSKVIHDIYTAKIMDTANIVLDLRNMSNLITDYIFAQIHLDPQLAFEEAAISLMNRVNGMAMKKSCLGNYININLNFPDDLEQNFGRGLLERANMDFKWNLCLNIIFDISHQNKDVEFTNFVEYIIFIITHRIRKAVASKDLSKEDKEWLTKEFTSVVLEYFSKDYDMNIFTLNGMRLLQNTIEEFLAYVEKPEDLLAMDCEDVLDDLKRVYEGIKAG